MTLSSMPPIHQKIKPLGWMRNLLRRGLLSFLQKIAHTDEGRAIIAASLKGMLAWKPHDLDTLEGVPLPPYPELGSPQAHPPTSYRADPIFITARFRTGSTLLWNLFRHIEGITAYYEPFNERRWFDPAVRGNRKDETHRNVDDYWWEYENLEELGDFYQEKWISHNLYMDATAWDPAMKSYVEILTEKAPGRPVLQFNRIDFRLPWFRRTFPVAKIVHLYRHPREEWCSALMDLNCFPKDGSIADFRPHDKFYLLMWAQDLKYHFPFLDERVTEHPYQLFYFIWKLSYLFGCRYADYSLAFEHLIDNPVARLTEMFEAVEVENYDLTQLLSLIVKPSRQKWKEYADDDWFKRHETHCENVLAEFLGTRPACRSLAEVLDEPLNQRVPLLAPATPRGAQPVLDESVCS